jgi:hypothetical protein
MVVNVAEKSGQDSPPRKPKLPLRTRSRDPALIPAVAFENEIRGVHASALPPIIEEAGENAPGSSLARNHAQEDAVLAYEVVMAGRGHMQRHHDRNGDAEGCMQRE